MTGYGRIRRGDREGGLTGGAGVEGRAVLRIELTSAHVVYPSARIMAEGHPSAGGIPGKPGARGIPGVPGAVLNGSHFSLRLPFPADFLCLIRGFICPCFPGECKMNSVGGFQRDSCSKTCHYRSLRFEDPGPGQATGRGAGGTSQMEIAGRGTARE